MSRRTASPLALVVVASLHCGDVLGQSPVDAIPTAPGDGARDTTGGEQAPSDAPLPAGQSCLDALAATGAVFTRAPADDQTPPLPGCGMIDGVSISRGPSGLQYRPPIRVSCAFARALPAVERVLQETATELLGERIEVARTMGSYGCRTIQSTRSPGRLSEHAVGNAIDVGEWWTRRVMNPHPTPLPAARGEGGLNPHPTPLPAARGEGGLKAVVVRDFRGAGPEGAFLRALAERLRASGTLERLLDPDYDSAHRNHFHLEGHLLP